MHKILIGAPVRQEAAILTEFLRSLRELHRDGLDVDFVFVDDNVEPASTDLLRDFATHERTTLLPADDIDDHYAKSEYGHVWTEELFWKVARFKDRILRHALATGHDGVFLIDSDLVLHPTTLRHLVAQQVDIVSEVFWTRWHPGLPDRPQVWVRDQYTLHEQRRDESLTQEEIDRRKQEFFMKLLRPGLHEVGGLGACTLISRRALQAGVNFAAIANCGLWGEDRHFCLRAAVLGLRLHADTHYPPLHVYRHSELPKVATFHANERMQDRRVDALRMFREAMVAFGTTHYATMRGEEGLEFFGAPLRGGLMATAAGRAAMAQRTLEVNRTNVLWTTQKDLDDGGMHIGAALVREGSRNGVSFREDIGALATLRDDGPDGAFRITELQLQRIAAPEPVPIVRKTHGNRVLLSMLVKDEADRHLEAVLTDAARYVDAVLIVDDGSTDGSVALCERVLQNVPHTIVRLGTSQFHDEHKLRRLQWELARSLRPDWVLCLDADEMFEARMGREIRGLVDQDAYDAIAFRLYDFWSEREYRDDALWSAHRTFRPFLVRVLPTLSDEFRTTAQHCGRWPLAVGKLRAATSDLRLKHLGWLREADRVRKFERYRQLDPQGQHGSLQQYASILDRSPNLVAFAE